ncbi:hypothetical protein ES708_17975 [subsurface metagenome]
MEWKDKTLTKLSVLAKNDGSTTLISGSKQKAINMKAGQRLEIDWQDDFKEPEKE